MMVKQPYSHTSAKGKAPNVGETQRVKESVLRKEEKGKLYFPNNSEIR